MMKLSLKAALFSAFIFPGSGYFLVNARFKAYLSLLIVSSGLVIVMMEAVYKAQVIAEKIVSGHISYEISVIREQILVIPGRFDANMIAYASWLVALIWFVGIVDSYRLGRALQRQQ